ncbi:hypothetical protein [Sulfuricurvum sp.]|uniref:hypothetical protein n=1 Tax=Sulfuricurvum sp. TaxID=2025608 RepID=UPI003BB1D3B5
MQSERKLIIQYALKYEVEDINTYSGYKGDLIVKITTKDIKTAAEIQKFARTLNILEVVIKQNMNLVMYEVYCVTEDKNVYHLKTEEIFNEVHSDHAVKDPWGGKRDK